MHDKQKELDEFLDENLKSGWIHPSKSLFASVFFFVEKKDGRLHPVQDYQKLNNIIIKNRYPLLLIMELIDKLKMAKYFTKLNIHWGYNNIWMKDGDEWKTAFQANQGLFEPLVMFFSLTNSPTIFQTMMNHLCQDLINWGKVVVYMDDIIIFTATLDEHWQIVREVLQLLCEKQAIFETYQMWIWEAQNRVPQSCCGTHFGLNGPNKGCRNSGLAYPKNLERVMRILRIP